MTDIIQLISVTRTIDSYGDMATTETTRTVFAEVASIGMKEFYQAAATGLQPEIKFVLADYYDYQNEPLVQYNSIRYHVLRTYRNSQRLELICSTQVNPS